MSTREDSLHRLLRASPPSFSLVSALPAADPRHGVRANARLCLAAAASELLPHLWQTTRRGPVHR